MGPRKKAGEMEDAASLFLLLIGFKLWWEQPDCGVAAWLGDPHTYTGTEFALA